MQDKKDILRAELKSLRFPTMDKAKEVLMYLRIGEKLYPPTMYDLILYTKKKAPPNWYKDWGWPCLTWELMSNKYGAAAKHGKDGKVSHFVILLPPPSKLDRRKEDIDEDRY